MAPIIAELEELNEEVILAVSDNGVGIPETDFERALERFSRLSETSSSGLGLSLVQAIAEGHGGRLQLRPGESGLEATLRLPVGNG